MLSVDLMSLWNAVCSVLLCKSVRNKTHPLDKIRLMQVAGEFFLSRWEGFSLTERTEFTEPFGARFEPMRRWPLPQPLPRREGRDMWGYPYKTAIKEHNEAYILFIGVSRWLRPSLWATLSTHLFYIIIHWYSVKYLRISWFFSIFVYAIKQHIWLPRRR